MSLHHPSEDAAAVAIQAVFRGHLARNRCRQAKIRQLTRHNRTEYSGSGLSPHLLAILGERDDEFDNDVFHLALTPSPSKSHRRQNSEDIEDYSESDESEHQTFDTELSDEEGRLLSAWREMMLDETPPPSSEQPRHALDEQPSKARPQSRTSQQTHGSVRTILSPVEAPPPLSSRNERRRTKARTKRPKYLGDMELNSYGHQSTKTLVGFNWKRRPKTGKERSPQSRPKEAQPRPKTAGNEKGVSHERGVTMSTPPSFDDDSFSNGMKLYSPVHELDEPCWSPLAGRERRSSSITTTNNTLDPLDSTIKSTGSRLLQEQEVRNKKGGRSRPWSSPTREGRVNYSKSSIVVGRPRWMPSGNPKSRHRNVLGKGPSRPWSSVPGSDARRNRLKKDIEQCREVRKAMGGGQSRVEALAPFKQLLARSGSSIDLLEGGASSRRGSVDTGAVAAETKEKKAQRNPYIDAPKFRTDAVARKDRLVALGILSDAKFETKGRNVSSGSSSSIVYFEDIISYGFKTHDQPKSNSQSVYSKHTINRSLRNLLELERNKT